MTRESCIAHPPKQAISIVRQDYYELTGRDACAAALLNIFEYWANAALAADASVERPWVGARPIREFERLLLGIATDKQIRKRLAMLEASGFIHTRPPAKRGAAKEYQVRVTEIQQAISQQVLDSGLSLRSFDPSAMGASHFCSEYKYLDLELLPFSYAKSNHPNVYRWYQPWTHPKQSKSKATRERLPNCCTPKQRQPRQSN